ncbi:MAG: DEAD/DEAH box helicase family protein [Candidatus Omnitrophica bacterium]|nr:DEAD/DEAH box helicase family protein [Candidatus Omnitrophota bacterium]
MYHIDPTEMQTRKKIINSSLEKVGWQINDHSHVLTEFEIAGAGTRRPISDGEAEYETAGFSDYLLLDRAGDPLAIVEAKRTSRDPIVGKQQAEDYADGIQRQYGREPLIFLTNGYEIWYWNRQRYAPSMVHGFFSREDLERTLYQNEHSKDLHSIPIKPEIINRDYQIEGLKRIFNGLQKSRRKFLLVMATGTGKTRTAMALIDVLIRAGWAQRVLFLVDREALAQQAYDNFKEHLPNESRHWIRYGDLQESKRLNVATIQTMMGCFSSVSPGFFDVVISDECHRSIYNKWKDVLSYFHAIQIGLTATPSDFLDRDTFKFFSCENGHPTFNYAYNQAIEDKYLVDFRPPYAAKTNFQITGIKGNELPLSIQKKLVEEGLTLEEIDFEGTDLEKKVTNLGTNESLVREFMDVCLKDDSGVVPGKSIIFALSHEHAKRLWMVFNELYPEYQGKLVDIIDSKMERPLKLLDKFKNENYPRVAISVDMLDTGVDIREVVNLVFAKPVFSKIKFWQMIGRGTRTLEDDLLKRKSWCIEKDRFLIIDHWNNFQYFGEKPEGEVPAQQEALPVKVFRVRLKKLNLFRQSNQAYFDKVKEEIINDIQSLPEPSITVRENLRNIHKALSKEVWDDVDTKSIQFLDQEIAPLLRCCSDINIYQYQFLLKVENLGLACITHKKEDLEKYRTSITNDIKCLPRNLKAVKEQESHIIKVLSSDFWHKLDYEKIEYIKTNLTEIMKYKRIEPPSIVKLDLDDEVIERKWIEFGPEGEGDYVYSYRKNVEKRVIELAESHPALVKIKQNKPISDKDLVDLEDTLNSPELYINEDNLRKTYACPYGSFLQFIKSILGLYKFPEPEEIINESFNTYVIERNNHYALTAEQIRFLRTIKNVFAKKKHIEYDDLFEPPFTQFGIDAATRLFSEEELQEIIGVFNSIKV